MRDHLSGGHPNPLKLKDRVRISEVRIQIRVSAPVLESVA